MTHIFENDAKSVCVVCGATQAEIDDNIATVECLGPAGYRLRKEACQEVIGKPEAKEAK
jgi:hypothetical protein